MFLNVFNYLLKSGLCSELNSRHDSKKIMSTVTECEPVTDHIFVSTKSLTSEVWGNNSCLPISGDQFLKERNPPPFTLEFNSYTILAYNYFKHATSCNFNLVLM